MTFIKKWRLFSCVITKVLKKDFLPNIINTYIKEAIKNGKKSYS